MRSYLVSWLLKEVLGPFQCSLSGLRTVNVVLPALIWCLCYGILRQGLSIHRASVRSRLEQLRHHARSMHQAMNICLFPPLFFFSALYYTDVISTTSVLVTLWLRTQPSLKTMPAIRKSLLFINGIIALSFRQTNIFWVAIFPAILDVIDVVKQEAKYTLEHPWELSPEHPWGPDERVVGKYVSWSFTPTTHPVLSVIGRLSLKGEIVFDIPVTDAIWDGETRTLHFPRYC